MFEDELDDEATAMALAVEQHGAAVPALFRWEIQSALLLAVKRGRLTDAVVDTRLDDLDQVNIFVDPDMAKAPFRSGVMLVRRFGLSPYDASYLELAARLRKPLMTRDAKLADAARELECLWRRQ